MHSHGAERAQHKGGLVAGQDAVRRVHSRTHHGIALARSLCVGGQLRADVLRQLRPQCSRIQEIHAIAKLQLYMHDCMSGFTLNEQLSVWLESQSALSRTSSTETKE